MLLTQKSGLRSGHEVRPPHHRTYIPRSGPFSPGCSRLRRSHCAGTGRDKRRSERSAVQAQPWCQRFCQRITGGIHARGGRAEAAIAELISGLSETIDFGRDVRDCDRFRAA